MRRLLLLGCLLTAGSAWAQPLPLQYGPGAPPVPNNAQFVTSIGATVINVPANAKSVRYGIVGGAGGSGCGIVQTSGTSASGGASGGSSTPVFSEIILAQAGNPSTITISVGDKGTSCTASGTTNGSTGSAPSGGGVTSITVGTIIRYSYGGGAGSNGVSNNNAGGGGCGSPRSVGGNGSAGTAGTSGSGVALACNGGTTTGGFQHAFQGGGVGGTASVNGAAGVNGNTSPLLSAGGSGAGLAGVQAALAGGLSSTPWANSTTAGGLATCTAGSQNGANATASSVGLGLDLTGAGGGGGASCTAAAGGNGGAAFGYGASGGGGGSANVGAAAGSGGASVQGAAWVAFS